MGQTQQSALFRVVIDDAVVRNLFSGDLHKPDYGTSRLLMYLPQLLHARLVTDEEFIRQRTKIISAVVAMDAEQVPRAIYAHDAGRVASEPVLGGLHHRDDRDTA